MEVLETGEGAGVGVTGGGSGGKGEAGGGGGGGAVEGVSEPGAGGVGPNART